MSSKFNSTYFKTDKDQLKGPQARCHDWADRSSLQFFVAVDAGPAHYEYSSYRDASAFLEAYEGVPAAERCFFEQICEGQACAEYYDIDWALEPSASAGAAENTVVEMEQSVFAAFLRVRNQHAPEYAVTEEQCRVLSASSSKKVSLHISVPTIVFENNHRHMKAFMLAFQATWCASLDAELLQHIDMGVYSKNRLMRILGSHKSKDPSRPLQRTRWHAASMAAEDSEFLLTNTRPGSVRIASIPDATAVRVQSAPQAQHKPPRAVQSSLPEWIVDAVRAKFMRTPYAAQFEMQCVTDRALIFKLERKAPGRCVVCNRDHDRENAFLKLTESGAVFLHCHRSSDLAGVEVCKRDCALEIGILTAESPHAPPGLVQADITDDARYLTHRHLAPQPEPLKLGRGKLEVCGQQPPSLLIRCDTGGGKTVFTEKLVAANKKSRFVAVTCRRTLA
ncbi:hypothetical protein BGZ58_002534 [Dissophora ornata]|nr:hypothetical protein BGZ58_002534 [Dissophora ornata]